MKNITTMQTYFELIQRLCNCKNTMFFHTLDIFDYENTKKNWNNLKENNGNSILTHMYFFMSSLSTCRTLQEFIKEKHRKMNDFKTNVFIKTMYQNIMEIIYKAQRHYNALSYFAKIIKYKKEANITDDLLLIPIASNHSHMKILHENKIYLFTIKDLINIINSALSNCSSFYAEPKEIKNPYNNVAFGRHILYNMYYAIKRSDYTLPLLFHQYYLCHFHLRNFTVENEYLIRDIGIKNVVYNTDEQTLFRSMKKMIEKHLRNIRINDDVDKQEFIKIMRPYYYLYLIKMFHVHGVEKTYKSYSVFNRKLHELYEYNCSFGRVLLKREPISRKFKKIQDLDHPKFTMNEAMNYEIQPIMSTHFNESDEEEESDTD